MSTKTGQDKAYSLAQASQKLNKSESTIKGYKKLVLEAFTKSLEQVVFPNGMLTEHGLQQLKMAARFIQKGDRQGYIKAVFQAQPHLEYPLTDPRQPTQATDSNVYDASYTGVQSAGSLVPRRSSNLSTQFAEFDRDAAIAELQQLQLQGRSQAENLNTIFTQYGLSKTQQALLEIDMTVEAWKTNTMAEIGEMFQPKKPQPPRDGGSAGNS